MILHSAKELEIFEKKFASLIGTKYAVGVNSGTDAIKLSLAALGIKNGDEVITAANTFVATVGGICELGAKPVFVDVLENYCMDADLIEAKSQKEQKQYCPFISQVYTKHVKNNVNIKKI